ncbi:hypothetical protein KR038_010259, partial [Drosophila bunnanda]
KMADKYSSDLCRIVIAQITQTIGYSSTLSAPLELLQDVMQKFMDEFARDLHLHMEHANRLEPSVKDARHSLKSLNINVQELLDYIGNVEPVGFTRDVPQFPIKRASNMNFLKPGSAETLTRPIHIFEYLPPMQETECRETEKTEFTQKLDDLCANTEIADKLGFNHHNIESQSSNPATLHFPSSSNNNVDSDQNRSSMWELSSVVMTTGGFISPAIEGKLPEAVVPDIIDKYKGLDAPPIASLISTPLDCSPKVETTSTVNIKAPLSELEIDNDKQMSATITTTNANSDPPLFNNSNLPAPKASTKKYKKQKDGLSRDKNDIKTQEKAQRKAMKLYQKLAKNQNDESKMFNLKKSRKSADGNRAQLEKLMRKQAKQRQKQLKGLTVDNKNQNYVENPENVNAPVSFNAENPEPVKSCPELIPAVSASQNDQSSGLILAEAKKPCEPERNKLDIFKKITKQRTVLPPSNAFSKPIIAGNPPIISLPSGTTITPTNAPTPLALPLIALNSETTIRNCNLTEQRQSSEVNPVDILVKPKKRGRKPGGKNQIKPTNLAPSQSVINLPIPNLINSTSISAEQPLNLSNFTDQSVNLISKKLVFKEKKERKKGKLKYETLNVSGDKTVKEINKNMMYTSPEKISSLTKLNVVHDQFVTSPNTTATPLYSAHQGTVGAGMVAMPLLPLLHFPPQPGLIPTGPPPGIFPGVVPGLVGFGGGGNAGKVGMPPFFAFSGPPDTSIAVKNDDETKTFTATNVDQVKLFGRTSSENRNYCNVAPLIPPDAIKLNECGEVACVPSNVDNSYAPTLQKGKATGNLGDPIEVSDEDSDEAIEKGRKPETPQLFENKSQLDLRSILPIPDKAKNFKSPVKLSLVGSTPPSTSSTPSISTTTPFPPRFQLPSFMGGGDKFSLAGGADLIPLSRVDCGSAYSSQKVPSNSLTAQHYTNDDNQSFLPKFPTYEDITITPTGVVSSTDLKQRKHHKKLKKIKEGKVKKKKDKKEKTKEKDLTLDGSIATTSDKSDKKKQKKKKDKQQTTSIIHIPDDDGDEGLPLTNNIVEHGPAANLFVGTTPATAISPKSTPTHSPTQIPKLTLKLSGKSTPLPLPLGETMDIKTPPTIQRERDHSPELARFSPLVTGPPKTKQCITLDRYSPVNPTSVQMPSLVPSPTSSRTLHPPMISSSSSWMSIPNDSTHTHTSATCTLSASSVLLPQQLMLMTTPTPKPNINNFPSMNVAAATSGRTSTSNSPAENSPQVAETKNHHRPSSYVDAEGNRIWICPACGKVDDGSAMIGCDGCDAWYHWICVGITIAPKDNDDWFCRVCITKKKVGSSDKKAKKRNKKK